MERNNARALTEGAILAAITVVIGIIRFYLPFLFFISYFWAIPIIIVGIRHNFKVSITASVVASLLVSLFTQPVNGLELFISFALPGAAMGYMLNRKWKPNIVVFASGLILAVCTVIGIALTTAVGGVHLADVYNKTFNELQVAMTQSMDQAMQMYTKMGISTEQLVKQMPPVDQLIGILKIIIPAIIIWGGLFSAFVNFKITKMVLKRVGHEFEDLTPFSQWRVSTQLNNVIIVILLFIAAEMFLLRMPSLEALTLNLFIGVLIVYLVIGLSAAVFFLRKYNVPKALSIVILVFAAFQFGYFLALLGVFEMAFDFRKLKNSNQ